MADGEWLTGPATGTQYPPFHRGFRIPANGIISKSTMNDFQLAQFKSLTQEIKDLQRDARQLELYCAGAVATLFSWYATVELNSIAGWYLPLLIPILGMIRSWAFHERARQISGYLMNIEAIEFREHGNLEGWENHYAKIRPHTITPSGLLFWLLLTVICLVFPFVYSG